MLAAFLAGYMLDIRLTPIPSATEIASIIGFRYGLYEREIVAVAPLAPTLAAGLENGKNPLARMLGMKLDRTIPLTSSPP